MAGDLTFRHLAAGTSQTCGIGTTGKGWCRGWDGDGDDGQTSEYAPVAVTGGHIFATTY